RDLLVGRSAAGVVEAGFADAKEACRAKGDAELFLDLPFEGDAGGLAGLNVSAWEELVAMLAIAAEQKAAVVDQHAAGDDLDRAGGHGGRVAVPRGTSMGLSPSPSAVWKAGRAADFADFADFVDRSDGVRVLPATLRHPQDLRRPFPS